MDIKLKVKKSIALSSKNPNTYYGQIDTIAGGGEYTHAVLLFEEVPAPYCFSPVRGFSLIVRGSFPEKNVYHDVLCFLQPVPTERLTWSQLPPFEDVGDFFEFHSSGFMEWDESYALSSDVDHIRRVFNYGLLIELYDNCTYFLGPTGDDAASIDLTFRDNDHGTLRIYAPAEAVSASNFAIQWEYVPPASISPVFANKINLYLSDGSTTKKISVSATNTEYIVPANTYIGGNVVSAQVEYELNSGEVLRSNAITISFAPDSIPITTILQPKDVIVDGTKEIRFSWDHTTDYGTPQTAFDLRISLDQAQWTTILSAKQTDTSTTLPSHTLPSGSVYWSVRSYNSDNVPGNWSESAKIVVFDAPLTPQIARVTTEPKFSIWWQAAHQQSYEVQLDGNTIFQGFGPNTEYHHKQYESSGPHEVGVRVQNSYGLWSNWALRPVQLSNNSSAIVNLTVDASDVARLHWTTVGACDKYLIYRNETLIGETINNEYLDQFAYGVCTYTVRGVYNDNGSYAMSNAVTVKIMLRSIVIAAVNNPKWISLPLSTSSLRSTSTTTSYSVSYNHYVGVALPGADIGEAVDQTYRLDCAWPIEKNTERVDFEALGGRLVCVKAPSGKRIVGVIDNMSCEENRFLVSYSATITAVHWEEFDA